MKKSILFLLSLGMLVVCVCGALGVIGMRHQIASRAQAIKMLEQKIVRLEHRNQYLNSKIAQAHQPAYLQNRIAHKLCPAHASQIVYVHQHVGVPVAPKKRQLVVEPFTLSLDLAFLATTSH